MPYDIPAPMLAKAVADIPDPARTPGGLSFEPKWDGFRALISWDGTDVEIGYLSHDATSVELYLQETFTFLAYTAEASVPLTS